MKDFRHIPVLVDEVVDALKIEPGKKYIDATFGGGGHGFEIMKRGGVLLGLDQDPDAVENSKIKVVNSELHNLRVVQGNFRDIVQIAQENEFINVKGVLFDLGLSSYQLESSGRGFSFLREEPLDMRMSSIPAESGILKQNTFSSVGLGKDAEDEKSLTARKIVNEWSEGELYTIFAKFGEEMNARSIANSIIQARKDKEVSTTKELADLIKNTIQGGSQIHPATKVFQALRIAVNDELGSLERALDQVLKVIDAKGKLVVISFHSLEDRMVKQKLRKFEEEGRGTVITKKPIIPSMEELRSNRKARSAKMRVFEKS